MIELLALPPEGIDADSFCSDFDTFRFGSDTFRLDADSFSSGSDTFRLDPDSFCPGTDTISPGANTS